MSAYIAHDHQHDGIDRHGFLKCMAWAGTGVVFGVVGDRVVTTALADVVQGKAAAPAAAFSFVQISDSHIGFHKAANKNVIGTFEEAVRRINALPRRPAFVMHTAYPLHRPGDVAPAPLVVPAGELPRRIGIRTVQFVRGRSSLALKDEALA